MERPVSFSAEDIRDEKVKVLRCVPPIDKKDTLLGQYTAADGKPGYLDDDTVPKGSNCPTFAETVLWVNNPRWEGVPFIMKAGKGQSNNHTSRTAAGESERTELTRHGFPLLFSVERGQG